LSPFQIVAHRGIPTDAPENTIASFRRAVELGADAVELDVRLTADRIPVVYHYFYLGENTTASGAIYDFTYEQLKNVQVLHKNNPAAEAGRISTLREILETFGGKIGLEIEIKGPEPEAAEIIGNILNEYQSLWSTMEVTSYEPALLIALQEKCLGLAADLLFPRSESWMGLDVVQYMAVHRSRLARARAVHLHPTQLTETAVADLRSHGIEIHAWDVNDESFLKKVTSLGVPRLCTDNFRQALDYRNHLKIAHGQER
jgi:glycerophosphoryl diester phosphodiesterase